VAGRLIVCATPIGNLGDASPRLAEALGSVDVVFAEDTRRTSKLLRHLGIEVPLRSYFVGNEKQRGVELEERLERGEAIALVSDAGTPAVSDPGVAAVRIARLVDAEVTVVPGASAVTAALAVAGMPADRFVFEGFLPRRGKERAARIRSLVDETRTCVLFSATRRIGADLADLATELGGDRAVMVGRELTKLYEELSWTTLGEAAERWAEEPPRGEFTLVIAGQVEGGPDMAAALAAVHTAMADGVALSEAVRSASEHHGVRRRALYEMALDLERP
jgi:16S rRNA (cytidine1402-2'-O)-methyltransferase